MHRKVGHTHTYTNFEVNFCVGAYYMMQYLSLSLPPPSLPLPPLSLLSQSLALSLPPPSLPLPPLSLLSQSLALSLYPSLPPSPSLTIPFSLPLFPSHTHTQRPNSHLSPYTVVWIHHTPLSCCSRCSRDLSQAEASCLVHQLPLTGRNGRRSLAYSGPGAQGMTHGYCYCYHCSGHSV